MFSSNCLIIEIIIIIVKQYPCSMLNKSCITEIIMQDKLHYHHPMNQRQFITFNQDTQSQIIMIRKCLTHLVQRMSTPVLKKDHSFSELQLKALLQQPNELRDRMVEQINQYGQIKIPDYWKQALTDPQYGYYRHHNVFSAEGDFTTSPEISPLFGQMVATWLAVLMQTPTVNLINPMSNVVEKKFRIVELGGGRGMLMQDILKSFRDYKIQNYFDLCFIQISEFNRKEQQQNVMNEFKKGKTFFRFDYQNATEFREEFVSENQFKEIKLSWFSRLQDLLKEDYQNKKNGKEVPFTIFIMNEFFDALPVTIFEYTKLGWREKVLKLSTNPFVFELINSANTPNQKLVPTSTSSQIGDRVELSPESYIIMDMMTKMIKSSGGAILNIDYGGNGPFSDSIRAIKNHKYIPAPQYWQLPGVCDLSAHVAFSALAQYAERVEGIKAFELVPQQFFLQAMGIQTRFEMLSKGLSQPKLQRLQSEVQRLTSPDQMGDYYKVQIISLKEYGQIYPHITVNPLAF